MPKQQCYSTSQKNGIQPLDSRTFSFAENTRTFLRSIKLDFITIDDAKQLSRSAGSVGANYIEANESLSKKDFIYRIKICKKEAKESIYWLKLLPLYGDPKIEAQKEILINEATQLVKIFSSIVNK